ncbi:hypothetical protein EXIGLDRAFT_559274, partial [Exidia glandulosa HHB12029]
KACTVFDVDRAYSARVDVRACSDPTCQRSAGPDLGDIGVFNLNNFTLVTHALFSKYDSQFSNSETTFHAFIASMRDEYQTYQSPHAFMSEDLFRTCWFSFMNLQTCSDSFKCTECGDHPDVVIADGVTVAFQKRRRTSKLRPPTCV